MAGYDRLIDPTTGDYVDADGGEYEETKTIATAVYHQLKTERGRWWGDADAGSDLYLIRQKGLTRSTVVFAEDAIRTALQPFVDNGQATDVQVAASADAFGKLAIEASITDLQGGRIDVSDIAPVGEK